MFQERPLSIAVKRALGVEIHNELPFTTIATGLSVLAGLTSGITAHAALNDTGITWCANATTNNLACPISDFPRQDGDFGRDVTNNDDTDGHAGFSLTKLDSQGKDLPAEATSWDCVRDNVTGMIWENKTSDGGLRDSKWNYSWYNSSLSDPGTENGGTCYQSGRCDTEKYVQDVNAAGLCGFKDWRMPSPTELASIVDYSEILPAIDTDYFSNTGSDWFWASLPYADNSINAWLVHFFNGLVYGYDKYVTSRVRLVRSGQYFLLFEDLNDGTVSQTNTGLMWAKCAEGLSGDSCKTGKAKSLTWKQALQAANKSRLAGYDDWRLPNVKELQSLVDYSTCNPAIDSTYFPNTLTDGFWASSPYAAYSGGAWGVHFYDGGVDFYGKDDTYQVRLVRSGQSFLLFDLNVTKSGNGSGTVVSNPEGIDCGDTCSEKFQQNSSVTLTATADVGSVFSKWIGCTPVVNNPSQCTVQMTGKKQVKANFAIAPDSDLSITKITLRPSIPTATKNFKAIIQVQNKGTQAVKPSYLDVWSDQPNDQTCGKKGDAEIKLGRLAAGASKTVTVNLKAGSAGKKTLRAFIDSTCQIPESDETNNQMIKTYTVK